MRLDVVLLYLYIDVMKRALFASATLRQEDNMLECKDFERQIPDFIAQKMKYRTLKRFCDHALSCPDCREELTIQFLVTEGISHLEEGDAFDLNYELSRRMVDARKRLSRTERFINVGAFFELIAMVVILAFVFWIILG